MSLEKIVVIVAACIALLILLAVVLRILPKRLKTRKFIARWRELQVKCADPAKWPEALADADSLLDEALKKRRIKGKTTGERMVSAQRLFSDNDSVWFGHKLRKRYEANPNMELTEEHMKKALIGLQRALKDLGAFK